MINQVAVGVHVYYKSTGVDPHKTLLPPWHVFGSVGLFVCKQH